ncbi:MAG: type II secretion system F family protein [Bdellovibrionaceae bacterium]|nr:type II secretion system F family protein [Pseudobdellovibrionaceae bacterium]
MAKFLYQAKNAAGQLSTGQIDAQDEGDARVKLRARNLTPLRLVNTGGGSKAFSSLDNLFKPTVNSRDLQIFTRQFSTLINAGIPIVDSLKMLSEGKKNPLLKDTASAVREAIEGGRRLGDAMAQHPQVFDRFFVNMVRAGEEAGILDNILGRLSIYMEKSEKIKKQIKGAMLYPSVIVAVAIVVVTGILVFIIPKFQELYNSAGKQLPGVTQMVIKLSNLFINQWYLVIAVIVGVPFGLVQWYKTAEGRDAMDRFFIESPLFGELVQKAAVARMTRTLSTLLSSGVSVIEALEIAARTAGNRVIEEALLRSKEAVTAGRPLAAPLLKEAQIPDMVTQMIAIGEKSGTLDVMLGKIADFYEDDVENAVKGLTSLIEPLLMVVLGGIIAFLVTAMYLPIFDMASVAGAQ